MLSRELLHVVSIILLRARLRLERHARRRLLQIDINIDAWVDHCLILIALKNHIRVLWNLLIHFNVVMPEPLLHLRCLTLKRLRLKPFLLINQWLIESLKLVLKVLVRGFDITREVE